MKRPKLLVGLLAVLVIAGIAVAADADDNAKLVDLDSGEHVRSPLSTFDERDLVIPAATAIAPRLPAADRRDLVASLGAAYDAMEAEVGHVPSPFRPTTEAGPTLVFDAPEGEGELGVVFLHGYGGSFALQCWLVASAAREAGAITVCPSDGIEGHWRSRDAEEEVRDAISYARSHGAQRIVLVGLSNGSIGAARLAPRLRGEIDALALLSGVPRNAPRPGVPTLVLHGDRDHMTGIAPARAYARRNRGVDLEVLRGGTHFALIEQREDARDVLAGWFRRVRDGA